MAKRQRLANNQADSTSSNPAPRAVKQVKGRRGKLAMFPTMNLDILFEILTYLSPIDLLHLARTSKVFRRMLISKSSAFLWRSARQNITGLPNCPPELSEPQYAALAFEGLCSGCGKKSQNIMWQFRVRLCIECRKRKFTQPYHGECKAICNMLGCGLHDLRLLLPEGSFINLNGWRTNLGYYVPQVEALLKAIPKLSPAELPGFVADLCQKTQTINEHAALCEAWHESVVRSRGLEIEDLRQDRGKLLEAKLVEEGWGDVIKYFGWERLSVNTKLISQPKALTARIWQNIYKPLTACMEQWRELMMEETLYSPRRRIFVEAWGQFVASLPSPSSSSACLPLPADVDICSFGPIDDIIRSPPEISADAIHLQLMQAFPQVFVLVRQWHVDVARNLASLLPGFAPSDGPEAIFARLQLAKSVFHCKNSRYCKMYYALRYPEILFHPCVLYGPLIRRTLTIPEEIEWAMANALNGRPLNIQNFLEVHERTEAVANIMASCGKDPDTTTKEEMDSLDPRVACQLCKECGKEVFMTWQTAVQHGCNHGGFHSCTWRMADKAEEEYIKAREGPAVLYHCPPEKYVYYCVRCPRRVPSWGRQDLEKVKNHLLMMHDVLEPLEGIDYAFDSNIVPVLMKGVVATNVEGDVHKGL
ncbi:hypothetical protein BV22DRAFT_1062539 [Leucogyrophana mollusca]|uniref:Uncharacterized protein n=1 Tax=Leucogyrophana mollusca TaxID=85980 RepID=A0ACB8BN94_9AGAM|nr:hypothetical protein BV22DRAFT_1062539 [Leucogyrophana mollusca]